MTPDLSSVPVSAFDVAALDAAALDRPDVDDVVLDGIAWSALSGRDAGFALSAPGSARARRFPPRMSPFGAVPDDADAADWAALAALTGPGETVGLPNRAIPAGWHGFVVTCDQMVDDEVSAAELAAARAFVTPLGESDVPDMLDLTARTKPGPFEPRTIDFGGYVGIRVDGRLAAMAGERLHPAGWTEVSAVCTDPDFRGRGYARTVVAAVTAGIRARGERAFLHVEVGNDGARHVYEALGFRVRTRYDIAIASPHPLPDAAH